LDLHPEGAGALVEQAQQGAARAAAKTVAADPVHGAAEVDLDVIPIGEIVDDRLVALAVVGLEVLERLVGEHYPEAEGVVRPVALVDRDALLRPGLLHQDCEVEAGRAAADHVDLHGRLARFPLPARGRPWNRPGEKADPVYLRFGYYF